MEDKGGGSEFWHSKNGARSSCPTHTKYTSVAPHGVLCSSGSLSPEKFVREVFVLFCFFCMIWWHRKYWRWMIVARHRAKGLLPRYSHQVLESVPCSTFVSEFECQGDQASLLDGSISAAHVTSCICTEAANVLVEMASPCSLSVPHDKQRHSCL